MEIQNAYRQKMATQLKEWNAQIALLEAKMENTGAEIRLKRAEQMQKLHMQQHAALDKMKELETASSEAWDQVKKTADKVWDDLKTGVADAHAKFK
jgi:outer membrane murein-binding lipoprotein Lpp